MRRCASDGMERGIELRCAPDSLGRRFDKQRPHLLRVHPNRSVNRLLAEVALSNEDPKTVVVPELTFDVL